MKVGFTGTRFGMSKQQKDLLRRWLVQVNPKEFHHGDCVGSDEEAATVARGLGIRVVAHPPTDKRRRAFYPSDKILDPKPYLSRNQEIVEDTNCLLVAPLSNREERRSGTWSTYRYANRLGKNVVLLAR